jgi:anti-anti-sigma factor
MSSYVIEMRDGGDSGEVHVALTGELDLTNAGELELGLDELADGGTRLVVDLNAVSSLDSAALHVLFKLARRCGRDRFAFVVDPGARIATTIEIVGLAKVATTRPSSDS